ncbi:MAG: hypothetical protein ACK4HQ_04245 [Brevinematales bacterium]
MPIKKSFSLLFIFLVLSCHQETFILLKNLDRAEWFSLKDFLEESGLSYPETTTPTNKISRPPAQPPSIPSLPQESRYMTIPANKEFVVQLPGENVLVSLKSATGVTYLKESSDPAQKFFSFQAHTNNGRAIFEYYNLDGRLQKSLTYYFQVQQTQPTPESTNITTRKPTLAREETNTQTNMTQKPVSQNVDWFLASLKPLSQGEAIKNLENALSDTTFSDNEKETLTYALIEYYLKQRLFTRASNRIENLQDKGYQAYYYGLYYESLQRPTKSLEYLVQALDTGGNVIPLAVIATGRVMINAGISDVSLITRLDSLAISIKDKDLSARAIIQTAQLYEGLRNLKRAKELYQMVLNGDYPRTWKEQAKKNLSLLDQQFR